MRGANCFHIMVGARLRMVFPLPAIVKKCSLPFVVHKLAGHEVHECNVQFFGSEIDWLQPCIREHSRSVGIICELVSLNLLRKLLVEESAPIISGMVAGGDAILKDNGQLTKGSEEVLDYWQQYILGKYLMLRASMVLKQLKICLLWSQYYILSRLMTRKAGGLSEILPEIILCNGTVYVISCLPLVKVV